jgi:hypothetical protein
LPASENVTPSDADNVTCVRCSSTPDLLLLERSVVPSSVRGFLDGHNAAERL